MQKDERGTPYLLVHTKFNSKWFKDLNIRRARPIQILEENIEINSHGLRLGTYVLDMTQKSHATKKKTDRLDLIKIKNFCTSKDIIKKVKRQHTHLTVQQ